MTPVSDFLAMGGYGGFVWPAFGVTALVLVWLLVASLRRLRANERQLTRMQTAAPAARPRRSGGLQDQVRKEATP